MSAFELRQMSAGNFSVFSIPALAGFVAAFLVAQPAAAEQSIMVPDDQDFVFSDPNTTIDCLVINNIGAPIVGCIGKDGNGAECTASGCQRIKDIDGTYDPRNPLPNPTTVRFGSGWKCTVGAQGVGCITPTGNFTVNQTRILVW